MSPSILLPSQKKRIAVAPGFDPQTQPIVPTCQSLPPLAAAAMQLDFICSAFNRAVEWNVEPVFQGAFHVESLHLKDIIEAAVFFPLVQRSSGLHVIFTRRASHLYDHAGQISFPGGRIEPTDLDAVAAALRETQEEIGVDPKFVQVIGTQPCFLTSTRFTMKPIIGFVRPGFTIEPDRTEVAEVFEVPLSFLMDPGNHHLHKANLPDGGHRYYFSVSWGPYFIWGATAALIRNFYHYLAAAETTLKRD
jgi:8-oxo-dGTP pyrophosphatase MutT (NUDIX family)